jgi:hypothetical protein
MTRPEEDAGGAVAEAVDVDDLLGRRQRSPLPLETLILGDPRRPGIEECAVALPKGIEKADLADRVRVAQTDDAPRRDHLQDTIGGFLPPDRVDRGDVVPRQPVDQPLDLRVHDVAPLEADREASPSAHGVQQRLWTTQRYLRVLR